MRSVVFRHRFLAGMNRLRCLPTQIDRDTRRKGARCPTDAPRSTDLHHRAPTTDIPTNAPQAVYGARSGSRGCGATGKLGTPKRTLGAINCHPRSGWGNGKTRPAAVAGNSSCRATLQTGWKKRAARRGNPVDRSAPLSSILSVRRSPARSRRDLPPFPFESRRRPLSACPTNTPPAPRSIGRSAASRDRDLGPDDSPWRRRVDRNALWRSRPAAAAVAILARGLQQGRGFRARLA